MSITPGIFDDDPIATPAGVVLVRRSISLGQSKNAKAVNRLLAQVESLRVRFEHEKRRLDEAVIFHAAQMTPRQERVTALRTDVVRRLAPFLDDRRLTKPDNRILRGILIEQLDEILAHVAPPERDIAELFERLHGVGFDAALQSSLDETRSGIAEIFDAIGLDMEMPDLRPDMSEEEVAATVAQIADRMRQLHDAPAEPESRRPKTRRELREEKRAERYEKLRKISIGAIYKRLVKVLHPDLELDPVVRERKSAVMQDVTAAYAANDLPSLLRLELEWIAGAGEDSARRTDETLNAYAEVLRQQIAQLRFDIADLALHPRYEVLVDQNDPFERACVMDGPSEVRRLEAVIEGLGDGLQRLSDEELALGEVRQLIRIHRRERSKRSTRVRTFSGRR